MVITAIGGAQLHRVSREHLLDKGPMNEHNEGERLEIAKRKSLQS